jgi:hypothetical protein
MPTSLTAPRKPAIHDWERFDPAAYLNEYYSDIGAENQALLRFCAETYASIPRGGALLDFGGGPALYPLIAAAARVDEIHFADYLETNLREVERWLRNDPRAFDWNPFIARTLELEGGEPTLAAVEQRAKEVRRRVTRVLRCDASRRPPLARLEHLYDVVSTHFCAESATSDRGEWRLFMANIASLLKPGGWLVVSALKGATRYAVGPDSFPAVDISEDDLLELLEELVPCESEIRLKTIGADRPSREYEGIMLAVAQKRVREPRATR